MNISTVIQDISEIDGDCLILGVKKGPIEIEGALKKIDDKLDGQISTLVSDGQLSQEENKLITLYTFGKLPIKQIVFVGYDHQNDFESVRDAAAKAIRSCLKDKVKKVVFSLDSFVTEGTEVQKMTHAIGEGAALGAYKFKGYAFKKKSSHEIENVVIASEEHQFKDEIEQGCSIAEALSAGTNIARDLVNTPGNMLTPTGIAAAAAAVAEKYGMECDVLEEEEMRKLNMGGLLGVAQGSSQPPKLIAIRYKGRDVWDNVLGLVGKGISFDTGGISLKPGQKMEEMIGDMGGAAAVIGALEAIGRLKPETNVLAIIPCAENMPSGTAIKPGDVLTTMSGRTVEVVNTDAEGRLVLADGVTYAKQLGADYIVDVATLTGAVLVALGTCTTGAVSNNEAFVEEVMDSAGVAGEPVWQLPAFERYKEKNKSRVADLKNTGGRYAGSITAGLFIGEFAEDTPWVHLDIAGTSWADKQDSLSPIGGTGAMTRTLAVLAMGRSVNK